MYLRFHYERYTMWCFEERHGTIDQRRNRDPANMATCLDNCSESLTKGGAVSIRMFSFPSGRRNSQHDRNSGQYSLVGLDRNNDTTAYHASSGPGPGPMNSEGNNSRNPQEPSDNHPEIERYDDRNMPSPNTIMDFEGDIPVENTPERRTFTVVTMEQEQLRRQQILRLGLIAILVLFLLDGSSYTNVNPNSGHNGNSSQTIEQSLDEIRLSNPDLLDAKSILLPIRPSTFSKRNATGIFKGSWQSYNSPSTLHYPETDYRSYFNSPNSSYSFEEGSIIITLKSVPIHELPDLSFVYGITRTYDKRLRLISSMSFPMQGVLLTSEKKLLMFSTPYKTQKLMVQFSPLANSPTSAEQSQIKDSQPNVDEKTKNVRNSAANDVQRSYELVPTATDGITFRIKSPLEPSLPDETHNLEMKLFVWDSAISKFNSSQWAGNFSRTFPLGENQLSSRFRYFQMSRPTMIFPVPSFFRGTYTNARHAQDYGDQTSPSINHIQTPATLASDCFYALELNLADHRMDISQLNHVIADESSVSQIRKRTLLSTKVISNSPVSTTLTNDTDNSVDLAEHNIDHRALSQLIPASENLHGAVKGFFACAKTVIMSVSSYQIEYDALRNKVEVYSMLYTAICLMQVVFVIFQIRYSSTQAIASRMSVVSILSQSVLDAVICMGHLLLGTSVSDLFFGSFIWVSVLKLLLFSVFQMRLVISAYQAHMTQEMSFEGLRWLRARLVTMHVRFYGVVLFILIVGFSFPIHPMIIVICLYSFWVPQIVHNVQHGTRQAFHPVYLFGMTVSRLFLPLYIMGCPKNFLVGLWEYFSPSGHLSPNTLILSTSACYFLVIWLSFQVIVLHLQNVFGARFFVPKQFLPQEYDYHRPLPQSLRENLGLAPVAGSETSPEDGDLETGALLRGTSSGSEVEMTSLQSNNNPTIAPPLSSSSTLECVICYNPIEVQGYNNNYMITPCDHVFHEECLQQWLRVKLECPVCRTRCPPADEDSDANNQ